MLSRARNSVRRFRHAKEAEEATDVELTRSTTATMKERKKRASVRIAKVRHHPETFWTRFQTLYRNLLNSKEAFLLYALAGLLSIYLAVRFSAEPLQRIRRSFSSINVHPAVIGGTTAHPDRYPYVANLVFEDGFPHCGGTLISPKFVLTAAHCVLFGGELEGPDVVWIGRFDLSDESELGEAYQEPSSATRQAQLFNSAPVTVPAKKKRRRAPPPSEPTQKLFKSESHLVENVFVHPAYDASVIGNDMALIELQTESSLPFALIADSNILNTLSSLDSTQSSSSAKLSVAGWGTVAAAWPFPSPVLMAASLSFVPVKSCKSLWTTYLQRNPQLEKKLTEETLENFVSVNDKSSVCAAGLGKTAPCFGDSGGPLILTSDSGAFFNNEASSLHKADVLIGVTSFVPSGCKHSEVPAVFTNAGNSRAWIESVIKHPLPVPDKALFQVGVLGAGVAGKITLVVTFLLLTVISAVFGLSYCGRLKDKFIVHELEEDQNNDTVDNLDINVFGDSEGTEEEPERGKLMTDELIEQKVLSENVEASQAAELGDKII